MAENFTPFNLNKDSLELADAVSKNDPGTDQEQAAMASIAKDEYENIDQEKSIECNRYESEPVHQLLEELNKNANKSEQSTEAAETASAPAEEQQAHTNQQDPPQCETAQDQEDKFESEMSQLIRKAQNLNKVNKDPLLLKKYLMDKSIKEDSGAMTGGALPSNACDPFSYCIDKILEDNNGSLTPRLDSTIDGTDRHITMNDVRVVNAVTKKYDDNRNPESCSARLPDAINGDIPAAIFKSILYTIRSESSELSVGLIRDDDISFVLEIDHNNFAEIRRTRDSIMLDVKKVCNKRNVRFTATISRYRPDKQVQKINSEIDSVIRSIAK